MKDILVLSVLTGFSVRNIIMIITDPKEGLIYTPFYILVWIYVWRNNTVFHSLLEKWFK